MTLDGSRRGLAACLANQEDALNNLRQELVRTNLANQTLINEKVFLNNQFKSFPYFNSNIKIKQVELQRKMEERDRQIADLRRQLAAKDRVLETQRAVLEEASHNFTPALRAKVLYNYSNKHLNKFNLNCEFKIVGQEHQYDGCKTQPVP